jgi:hypothetical protein
MKNRFFNLLLLLSVIGFGAAGCESPYDMPVASSDRSYGLLASNDLGTYFYSHRAGVTYVYSNVLRTEDNGSITVTQGLNDTVRTLGHAGFTSSGDSVFAYSVKYRVVSDLAGRGVHGLRYLPAAGSFGGAYIDASSSFTGERSTLSLSTRAVSIDSSTAPCYGRMRSFASDLQGNATSVWQTDTVYFTSSSNHVALWEKTASGSFVRSKDIFRSDVTVQNNAEWDYSTWQTSTKIKVLSDNAPITIAGTNYGAIMTSVTNSNLNLESTQQKYFAPGRALARQVDSWFVTTNGTNRIKKTIIREDIVVIDPDENA